MKLSVIVPVYNGGEQLVQCLQALAASTRRPDEVIIVDDGSTEAIPALAEAQGFRLLRNEDGPRGPAVARNRGVAVSNDPDLLLFVDADVLVQPQTIGLIEAYFETHADVTALFGSYDDSPPARSIPSLYKNLLHHYTHQHSDREASTFWAGCGAVRADAYRVARGFSENYARPAVEDIELGMRLRKMGYRIHLCPEIQVTHLKHWSLWSMIRTDVFSRALPWSRLLVASGPLPNDLNLQLADRASAVLAWVWLLALAGMFFEPALAGVMLISGVAFVALNWPLLRFFAAQGGWLFACAALGLHLLYYLYSSAAFAWVAASRVLLRPFRS